MTDICGTCKKPENFPEDPNSELRPYGPGGSFICYSCAFRDEDSTKATEEMFLMNMEAELNVNGIFVIGDRRKPSG